MVQTTAASLCAAVICLGAGNIKTFRIGVETTGDVIPETEAALARAVIDVEVIYEPIKPEGGFSFVYRHEIEIAYARL